MSDVACRINRAKDGAPARPPTPTVDLTTTEEIPTTTMQTTERAQANRQAPKTVSEEPGRLGDDFQLMQKQPKEESTDEGEAERPTGTEESRDARESNKESQKRREARKSAITNFILL